MTDKKKADELNEAELDQITGGGTAEIDFVEVAGGGGKVARKGGVDVIVDDIAVSRQLDK